MIALTACLLASFLPAFAAPVPDDTNADVVASATVHAPPQAVLDWLSDLRHQETALADCTRDWEHGAKSVGVGASAELVYKAGPFRRKLVGTISQAELKRLMVDHAGKKGFITTWTFSPAADGADTTVELRTLLNLPPKPFRKVYMNKVQPVWQTCYAAALLRHRVLLHGALSVRGSGSLLPHVYRCGLPG